MDAIKFVLVENNPALAGSITRLLSDEHALDLVGYAPSAIHALDLIARARPDVILLDVLLPDMGVLEAISLALEKSPRAKIILLADRDEARYYHATLQYGASACLRKDRIAIDLIPLIKQIALETRAMKVITANESRVLDDQKIYRR